MLLKFLRFFLSSETGSTLAVTYSFSPNTLIIAAQVNTNFGDVVAVVNALTSVNYSDDSVTAAKLNGDVVRATYGLIQHTDGSLYVDVSDTNPALELTDGGLRVKVDGLTIGRGSGGLLISVLNEAQGDILYRNASGWVRLAAGTAGQTLKTLGAAANPIWADVAGAGVLGSAKNLRVVRNSNTQVTVTADELVLEDASNNKAIIRSVSEAIAITTSGASGLVAALTEAGNTIYYIWIARKSSDGTVNGYLSTTTSLATFLTQVDSGYDQACLVSCVGNDNSSNFIDFIQQGHVYTFTTWATLASGSTSSVSTSIDLTPANMSTNAGFVPAISDYCFGALCPGSTASLSNISPIVIGTTTPNKISNETEGDGDLIPWSFDVRTADTLYWASDDAGATIYLQGFLINKLAA